MKKWKVVGTAVTFGRINEEPVKRLEEFGCEVILNPYGRPMSTQELIALAADADAVIVGNDKVTAEFMDQTKNLKIIAKHGVGVDGIDLVAASERGIIVTNAPATNNEEVADLTFGFLLMLARGMYEANRTTKNGEWLKPAGVSLTGKTFGIVGTGAIGLASAKRALGFNMNILGYDVSQNAAAKEIGMKYVSLDELLQKSDFVTLHLPLTKETNGILDAKAIASMKEGAILIDTARSQLVDYDALEAALRAGKLRGYATDVFPSEPPELISLYELPNVLLTPHTGGTTKDSNLRMGNFSVDNVLAVLSDEKPPYQVN